MEYNMTNLKEFTYDYINRTIANCNTIFQEYTKEKEYHKEEEIKEAFEVTQLINSLFGILIMPFESIKALKKGNMDANSLRDINQKMKETDEKAFNDLSAIIQELKEAHRYYDSYVKDYQDGITEIAFIHRLRNSLAHSGNNGLRFFPIGEANQEVNRITSIIFCDEENNGNGDSFIVELSVEQVKGVLESLSAIFSNFEDFVDFYGLEAYQKEIRSMRKTMDDVYEGIFDFDKRDLRKIQNKFKGNLRIEKNNDGSYRGYILVFDEIEFITWIFKSAGKYRLVGPEKAYKKMNNMAQAVLRE